MKEKKCDLIIANNVDQGKVFGSDYNKVYLITSFDSKTEELEIMSKYEVAEKIAEKIDYKGNIATINTNLAIVFHTRGNFPYALQHNLDAARIFEEIEDFSTV